ncbi:hypothetical protein [Flavobacterium cerinum]|uniref:Uncharacterized protein n=1 Tax=Flavobacterium cerinum TaxID=2502784 RepID=A0ABY5IPT8_9FLAO|nr:hypothetical protein [Flavobacterium cerinum]UUC44851.1 hypothetical protein NOX80_14595 [Flavobacterium cerinum]
MEGLFIVSAFATINGRKYYLGTETVSNRSYGSSASSDVVLKEVKADYGLLGFTDESLAKATFDFIIHGKQEHLPLPEKEVLVTKKFCRVGIS